MPLYEYECEAGHRFEKIQKFSDPPVEKCPECGAPVHKVQSAPAFHLKGTGWYITDYAKKDSPATKTDSTKEGDKDTKKSEKTEKAETTSDKSTAKTEKPAAAEKAPSKTETKAT